ncbi:MAG: hypothetical protein ABR599_01060 [Gemmatimonadota bacterium]
MAAASRSPLLALLLVLAACAPRQGRDSAGGTQVNRSSVRAGDARVLQILTTGTGTLLVRGEETDSLSVEYVATSPTRAASYRVPVETIDKPDTLIVTIHASTVSHIDLHLTMPERMTVGLRDEARDVTFRNVENRVDVHLHPRGSLDFDDIEGPLQIVDGVGPIRVRDVRGPVVIQDEGGGISVVEVKNSVRIETRRGDVTLHQVGGDVNVVMGTGDLVVREVGGKLTYRKSGPGQVTIEEVAGAVERL